MKFTKDSVRIQNFIKKFDKIASENLTKTRIDVIKSFFIKLNRFHDDKLLSVSELGIFHNHTVEKTELFNIIPSKIRIDIEENYNIAHLITYIIHSKTVNYHIYDKTELNRNTINGMINKMNLWLSIAFEQASNECSSKLDIHLFLTDHKKIPPEYDNPIDTIHANTAFTTSCSPQSETYIYRKEEWFKVFIHETFHCLGLDFSHMDTHNSNTIINNIFSTNIDDIRLYESYTETWAEIFNLIFIAFFKTTSKIDYTTMFELFQKMYNEELTFSIYQMVSILKRQNIRYIDMIHSNRGLTYNEKTSAFSYFIIKSIIMFHMNHFITWCCKNNNNILNFNDTQENILKYCDFIQKWHSNLEYIKTIEYIENNRQSTLNTMRMTAFELL
jgi:hypothetical protein